jgi:hypothetical protein
MIPPVIRRQSNKKPPAYGQTGAITHYVLLTDSKASALLPENIFVKAVGGGINPFVHALMIAH